VTSSVFVFTFYNPRLDATATYAERLRPLHLSGGVELLEGVVAGHLLAP